MRTDLDDDFDLARRCIDGDPAALAVLEQSVLSDVRRALAHLGRSRAEIDDIVQRLRQSLLVGDGQSQPRLARYSGRGSLRRWVRTVAVRMAIRDARGAWRAVPLDVALLEDVAFAGVEPSLHCMKEQHREAVQSALADALQSLSPIQRNALRLHVVDRVSLDQLARLYAVHRATMARWLATTRAHIRQRTLDAVAERIAASESEAESLLRLVISRLELELEPGGPGDPRASATRDV
jgi:RNA polymerase sigma-70 factor, ECF subfamily